MPVTLSMNQNIRLSPLLKRNLAERTKEDRQFYFLSYLFLFRIQFQAPLIDGVIFRSLINLPSVFISFCLCWVSVCASKAHVRGQTYAGWLFCTHWKPYRHIYPTVANDCVSFMCALVFMDCRVNVFKFITRYDFRSFSTSSCFFRLSLVVSFCFVLFFSLN